jgi:uncharacterized repeat protein (TIGR03803 family)
MLRFARLFLLAGLAAPLAAAAQTPPATDTVIAFNIGLAYGILQAGDGNFYSPSIPFYVSCQNNSNELCAAIYQITPAGAMTAFHSFAPVSDSSTNNADGLWPTALIVGTDGNLYGACRYGGPSGLGTIFKITPSGTFSLLKFFSSNGATLDPGNQPVALIQGNDGNLYFTNGIGIYQLTSAGAVNAVYTYPSGTTEQPNPMGSGANSLVQGSDGNFYITQTAAPGPVMAGVTTGAIGQLTLGGGFSIIHTFAADGSEGNTPLGPLVEGSDGDFYGVTTHSNNASSSNGVAFKVSVGGSLTVLHPFSGGADGALVNSPLLVGSDGNFYGTTRLGGDMASANCANSGTPYGCGTVFQLTPSGSKTTVHNFEGGAPTSIIVSQNPQVDGAIPEAPLVQTTGGVFFGTSIGASPNIGTVFEISLTSPIPSPVQVTVNPIKISPGQSATLTWQVLNAFSITAQQCSAMIQGNPPGAGTWTGVQTGTFANSILSGSATITPTSSGTYTYALTCGGKESGFATLTVTGLTLETTALPDATVNKPYTAPLSAVDGVVPYTWSVSPDLPKGLSLDTSAGMISGTPKQFGTGSYLITVTDSSGPPQKSSKSVPLKVVSGLEILTDSLEKATINQAYKEQLKATGGLPSATGVYKWSVAGKPLPPGLALNSATGAITGTPTKSGNFAATFKVADYEATPATETVTLTLTVLSDIQIGAVEFTQAIQVYQALSDLKDSLNANQSPPIPIISGKPAVMRVYLTNTKDAATVQLTATGPVSNSKFLEVQPDCDPADGRLHDEDCPSIDLYFTPPPGAWSTELTLTDEQGHLLQKETLNVTSIDTLGINLNGVSVCTVPGDATSCQDPSVLLDILGFTKEVLPTSSVTAAVFPGTRIFVNPKAYSEDDWFETTVRLVNNYYKWFDQSADAALQQRTDYVGIYNRASIGNDTGIASDIPGHGLLIANQSIRLGQVATPQTIAHEIGHTLDLSHTGVILPWAGNNSPPDTPPGCWGYGGLDANPPNPWGHPTNYLWGPGGVESGFDVAAEQPVDGMKNLDVMGYCTPRWISPQNYLNELVYVNGSAKGVDVKALEKKAVAMAAATMVPSWSISGSIPNAGLLLDPIFTESMAGTSDPGTGTYSIKEEDANGQALFTRQFTPMTGETEDNGFDFFTTPNFSEWIPVTKGAKSIVIADANGETLKTVELTGAAPKVTIASPSKGFVGTGGQTVSWTATSTTAKSFTSRVFYSADGGKTWQQIDEVTDLNDAVDFTTLPAASAALIRVDVSDGVNTGSATSVPFSVSKKPLSTILINTPPTGAIQQAANPVYLSGAAYGADDGVLTGKELKWTDSAESELGTGSPLSVKLGPGAHTITLTATGSDGKTLETTTQITLAGAPPALTLTTIESAHCFNATIAAIPGKQGVSITGVKISLNGGSTYTAIPLAELPFHLPVSGAGTVNLVATAMDASGQTAARSTELTMGSGCIAKKLKVAGGSGQSAAAGSAFAAPLSVLVTDAKGNPQVGVIVTFTAPLAGAGATLSSATAMTDSSGIAEVTAKANKVKGAYQAAASAANATIPVSFALRNE